MNVRNTAKLFTDFPEFFEDKSHKYPCLSVYYNKLRRLFNRPIILPPLHSSLIRFGFECEDGWFDLIYSLCKKIKECKPGAHFTVVQVKEKYGVLCFYPYDASDIIWDLIRLAEYDSVNICMECGNSGERRGEGWIVTLCNKCWEVYEKRKK